MTERTKNVVLLVLLALGVLWVGTRVSGCDEADAERDAEVERLEDARDQALLQAAADSLRAEHAIERARLAEDYADRLATASARETALATRLGTDADRALTIVNQLPEGDERRPEASGVALSTCTDARRQCSVALDTTRAALRAERTARVETRRAYDARTEETLDLRRGLAFADSVLAVQTEATASARRQRDRYRRQRDAALVSTAVASTAAVLLALAD